MPMQLLERLCCARLPMNIDAEDDIEKWAVLRTARHDRGGYSSGLASAAGVRACHGDENADAGGAISSRELDQR